MRRHFAIATLILSASAVAVAAKAQETGRIRREPRTFTFNVGPDEMRFDMRRGRIGVTIDLRPDVARDTIGARVSGVTPGGAADRAGVQTGDIITRLNGTRLVADNSRDDDDERSRPGMRLINLASRLEEGDTVRLDIRRDNRNLTLTFAADRTDMDQIVERLRIPGNGTMFMRPFGGPSAGSMMEMPRGGTMRVMVSGNGFGDLELVKVTPQLAAGLGISEGLLVVAVDSASTLNLQPGDVITGIGGRRPTSPVHAMRILSSYDAGEAVSFDVMRQRRRATVSGRIPEARQGEWRIRPNSFDEDEMPLRQMMEDMPRMMEDMMPRKTLLRFDGRV